MERKILDWKGNEVKAGMTIATREGQKETISAGKDSWEISVRKIK